MRESIVFYKSFYDAIKEAPEEYQLELYDAIFNYTLNGELPENISGVAKAMFTLMKPNMDNAMKNYDARVENGKRGGRPKKETEQKPNKNQTETKTEPNKKLNDNYNVNDNLNDNLNDNYIEIDDSNKYITQLGLDKFDYSLVPDKTKRQIILYKYVIMLLFKDKREDILEKLTISILSKCWEKMNKKKVDNPIKYLKEMIINEVVNSG